MSTTRWLILYTLLSSSLLAQQVTNTAPADSAGGAATNAPTVSTNSGASGTPTTAPGSAKKKKTTKKAVVYPKPAGPLSPGPATVAGNHVNIRGQAKLNSEVVGQLNTGQQVTVIEEITRNTGPDEPSAWAKIVLPEGVHVWVNSSFIDPNEKTIKPRRLNLRGGPGENYSVLGRLQRGDKVKEVSTKGDWLEIEAPTNSYAFVAAAYLKQEPAGSLPVEQTSVPEPASVDTNAAPVFAAGDTNIVTTSTEGGTAPAADEPLAKRVVSREGLVRGTTSIQAPTRFELISTENRKVIDYLFTESPELDLRRYKGLHIVVTGEEGLDERWPNTPVLTIQEITVLE